jgi:hypothetical protein
MPSNHLFASAVGTAFALPDRRIRTLTGLADPAPFEGRASIEF